nr:hypothetical protein [Tanacetum cinerariifolium]
MEAGSKDRPPMLAPRNYIQWKSRIKRYIDTKPNRELIHYCLENPPYELGWKDKFIIDAEGNPTTATHQDSTKVKTVNEDVQIRALIDGKKIIVTEASIRRDLQLQDEEVLDLEKAKTAQAKEIADLKKRVKKLKRKKRSILGLKRLWKVALTTRVESSEDKESLGDQEDASKQRRMIDNIDQDVMITLVDETQGRMNEEEMFRVNDLDSDEAKDKGKGIMVEPKKPLKKKDQIAFDKEVKVNIKFKGGLLGIKRLHDDIIVTTAQRLARKNELKTYGTLLKALPDKHQLKFNIHKDAKTLMEAIEKRFGGKKETKKVPKTLLKQQYENFTCSSSESLDQIHDRLQKLISQLEILRESLSQKDINLKFLRRLPNEWRTYTLIWRNKTDLDDQSLDDLFNSLKIYEAEVNSSSSASTSIQNIAFVSSQNTDNTNESVSTVASVSAASSKVPIFALSNVDTLSDAIIYSFFASQSNSPQLENDDLKQIDADDLDGMDLKWQMAMWNATTATGYDTLQESAGHLRTQEGMFQWSLKGGMYQYRLVHQMHWFHSVMVWVAMTGAFRQKKNRPTMPSWHLPLQVLPVLPVLTMRESQFDVISYKTGLEFVEARILIYQQNETVFEEDIKLLKLDVQLRDNALAVLRQKFKKAEQERDELKLKLEKFQTSSKNISQLLASQTNDKTGLGYDTQVFTSSMFDCDEMFSSEFDVSMPASPIYDSYESREGYHVVPPPYTRTFMPPKPDLVFMMLQLLMRLSMLPLMLSLVLLSLIKICLTPIGHQPLSLRIGSLTQKMNLRPGLDRMILVLFNLLNK